MTDMDTTNEPDYTELGFRNWVRDILRKQELTVTFYTADGSLREMRCTTNPKVTPVYESKTEKKKKTNDDVCSVFDLDKNEWRSFRFDKIKTLNFAVVSNK